ncbi:Sucrase/ferredoxin-like-domain-containing protein [Zychaea mexicana]|uniref:Sucrase/ferredoxin-like-domain-containing protein n=1 Tax=Zychaea mexicana TaxID=64656 RepID=UPI0022FDFB4A|nr:Sucrase/ferredoxin-like-domain-containing protein [Zychaea mexicana]KAI9498676.1 Sucrase/ferredoxin-like-domain-containing protein [Zychaea mexicana]
MASLLRKIGNVVGYTSEEDAVDIDQIPPSDCIVEGDCAACPAPCDDHKQYPSYLQFDRDTPLLGSMKPYGRQVMISTGKVDWAEKIEEDEGSLAAKLSAVIKEQYDGKAGRIFITNTSKLTQQSTIEDAHDVIILPENIIVTNVTPDRAQAFFDQFLNTPIPSFTQQEKDDTKGNGHPNGYANGHDTTNGHPNGHSNGHVNGHSTNGHSSGYANGHSNGHLDSNGHTTNGDNASGNMQIIKNTHKSMILICSHKKRDKRCGITAPILGAEFDNVLREKDISEDEAGIYMVSHVGGHKFAGNVICYIHEGRTGIWYGRVNTCHCRAIIEETICDGKVIKDLYRGAMSHSFGQIKSDRLRW